MADQPQRLAVLIDSDNVGPRHIGALLAEISTHGEAIVRRMYGDWTTGQLKGWKEVASEHAIQPIQQFGFTTGKNSTDSALIIDAMDLLYTNRFDGFCLVSSDSDFTRLASRLRESGVTVYGFGERKTPQAFVNACNRFIYLDVLADRASEGDVVDDQRERAKPSSSQELKGDARLVALLRAGIEAASEEDGWANLGGVGSLIRQQAPEFDPRNWGFAKLGDLVEAIGLFQVERVKASNGGSHLRIKDARPRG